MMSEKFVEKHKYTYYALTKPNSMNRSQMLIFTSRLPVSCFKKSAGKIVSVKKGLIAKKIMECGNINIETIRKDITISKRKRCLTFANMPPYNNKATFLWN